MMKHNINKEHNTSSSKIVSLKIILKQKNIHHALLQYDTTLFFIFHS